MTLQKAMRVRSDLKKEAAAISQLLERTEYQISFIEDEAPSEAAIEAKRKTALAQLDGMTYSGAVKKLFAITDACLSLNMAIEKANRQGHEILFKEAAIKSKLALVEQLLAKERCIVAKTLVEKVDYTHTDSKGNYERREATSYNYPMVSASDFSMPLPDVRKQLNKELAAVRDELSVFNASHEIDWVLPEGLL